MQNSNAKTLSAFLYVRVSTEEQAVRGGSLKTQEETLRQYCIFRGIEVKQIFVEDHSAKTFNRPQWRKLFTEIKNLKLPPSFLLFTRWDRFSRNTGDAYYTIKLLKNLGIEPQAVEQPLDLSVPENKMMLAFYLSIPEVENDRRGLNTKMGMQRAKERGRIVGRAPIGYINHCYADGAKGVLIKEPAASIIGNAFEQLASYKFKIAEVYRTVFKAGLQCSYGYFWKLLQNPVYSGHIKITELNKSYLVPGLHRGIVSLETFNKVQALLFNEDKRKQNFRSGNSQTPLRGFISCPRCSRILYSSGSTGRSCTYYYYHCASKCGYRLNANKVHNFFKEKLSTMKMKEEYVELYRNVIRDNYANQNRNLLAKKEKAIKSIEHLADRIVKAKNLLLDSCIDYKEFLAIKTDLEGKINLLGPLIEEYSKRQIELSDKIKSAANFFTNPSKFLEMLDGKNRPLFFQSILVKGQDWGLGDSNQIFQETFRLVFGLSDTGETKCNEKNLAIRSLFETMSNLQLLVAE